MDDWRNFEDQTFLHPLGATALAFLGLLMFTLPRRWATLPFVFLICFIPSSQRIAVAGLDFNLIRILIIFGWTRMFFRGELKVLKRTRIDNLILAWGVVEAIAYILLHKSSGAAIYMAGKMFEAWGMYFLMRALIRDWSDVRRIAVLLAVLSVPTAMAMWVEKQSGRNWFSVFGGVYPFTPMRQGRLRAMGAIGNPILAGCYWAALLPIMGALWWRNGPEKLLGPIGAGCAFLIVIFCASSTPLGAMMAGFFAVALFPLRFHLSTLRWGFVAMSAALHVVMNAPVWHLIARIDLVGGSTGWHRFHLIDQWIRRTPEWFLLGTKSTYHWGHLLFDVTNQYVLEAVNGGMGAFVLFVMYIAAAYGIVGRLWRASQRDPERLAMSWAIGCCLFTHCVAFIGVSYFGQMHFGWYLPLAMAASLGALQASGEGKEERAEAKRPTAGRFAPPPRHRRLLGEPG